MKGVIRGEGKKKKYFIDGREVTKRKFDRIFPDKPITSGAGLLGWKPLVSNALAVNPSQVKEAIAHAQSLGVPTDFLPDGSPVFRTRQHYKEYCRQYGFFNKDGGYGDAQPGQHKRPYPEQKRAEYGP